MTAAVLVVAVLAVPHARGGTPWDACPEKATQHRDHVVVRGPTFSAGQPALTSIAADPHNMASLAATNGHEVQVSDDVGCTWTPVFTTLRPGSAGTPAVVGREGTNLRVVVPVRVVATVGASGLYTLRLFNRDNGIEASHELPPELAAQECSDTRRCFVRFAPGTDLAVGYAATSGVGDGLVARVGATVDGGRTWAVHDAPTIDGRTWPVTDLAVDPRDAAHVLAIAGGRLFESHDRGETWAAASVPVALSPLARVVFAREIPVTRKDTRDAVVVDRAPGGTAVLSSRDDGRSFTATGAVVPADPLRDVVVGPSPAGPGLVVAAGGRLFREGSLSGFDVLLTQNAAITQIAATSAGLWLRRAGALLWVDGFDDPDAVPGLGSGRPTGGTSGPPAGPLESRAGGGALHVHERVTVPPGETGATVVTADVARQPRGLDVFFLMDTSGSMSAKLQPMANALARVVEALNREGIAARFGLGEHGALSFRYRRHADLGTPPEEVRRKLAGLQTSSGEEYHYTSFYQIATGKGMQAVSGGSIPPGQQASFEPGALHVIVHATDETDNTDPEGPSEATALAALNDVDARHIGIYPYDGSPRDASNDGVTQALRRYAASTSTFAPPGGLDCDGDSKIDVDEGEPIACAILGSTSSDAPIASLIERVLLSLSELQPATLVAGSSPLGVEVVPLGDYGALDLHQKHEGLEFRVQVTCPPERQGSDVDVALDLLVGGVSVATAPLTVTCLAAPVPPPPTPPEEPEPSPRRTQPRLLAALPPAASTPPALAQSTATAQASSSASQSAQATQIGMAVAPDDALQVATEEEDVRFVAHRGMPATTPAVGVAFIVFLAALYAAQQRVAPALAPVRHRRDRPW